MHPTNHAQTEMYRNPDWRAAYDERYAPVPGWGVNPNLAGPRMVGIGQAAAPGGAGDQLAQQILAGQQSQAAAPAPAPSYGIGSAVGGLIVPAGIGILAMMATRHLQHRDASGATYGWAAGAGIGGAIVGTIGGIAVCSAMVPAQTSSATPTSADASMIGGWLAKCLVAVLVGTTVGSVAGGVLVGRKQGR